MGFKRIGLGIIGILLVILVGYESVDKVGKGMENENEYETITVDDVVLKGLDAEGLKGLYNFVGSYEDLEKVSLGKDLRYKQQFLKKYITAKNVRDNDKLCDYYYIEGFNLTYCNGLEEVLIKMSDSQIKRIYGYESGITNVTEDKEFTYKGVKYDVKYLITGEDKYLIELRLSV